MHSSRMRTTHCSDRLSFHPHTSLQCMPPSCHAHPLPCMPTTTHVCASTTHTPHHTFPLPLTPPQHVHPCHTCPCHACPPNNPPHTHTHAPLPHTTPHHTCPLLCMLSCHACPHHTCTPTHNPCHTCPPPCMPPATPTPLPCTPPAMHNPCHACNPVMHAPPPCMPPATHALVPCTPPAMHAPATHTHRHACPLPRHACLPTKRMTFFAVSILKPSCNFFFSSDCPWFIQFVFTLSP